MKKNLLWMLAAILLCGTMTTSCSKDDDDDSGKQEPKDERVAKTASAWYNVSIGDDMLDVFDVEVTTVGPEYGQLTKKLTKTTYSIAERDIPVTDAGLVFSMSVKLSRRADFTPDASKTYTLGFGSAFAFEIIGSNNKSLVGDGEQSALFNIVTVPGDKIEARISSLIGTWTPADQKLEVFKTYFNYNGKKQNY
jgi:hypothetical protein